MTESIFKPDPRGRRYSATFKSRLIALCSEPGASVAAIAREHGVSPATLQRWLEAADPVDGTELGSSTAVNTPGVSRPAFVPLSMAATSSPPNIRIELRRDGQAIIIDWPVCAAADCGVWLQGLLA